MNRTELERRTLHFALKIIEFVGTLPRTKAGEVVEFQLVKAGTSVGANYREATRAESRNDFIHKLAIVEKSLLRVSTGWNYVRRLTLASSTCASG